jgi:hypothetical protein
MAIMPRFLAMTIGVIAIVAVHVAHADCEYPIADLDKCPNPTPHLGSDGIFLGERKGCGPGNLTFQEEFSGVSFHPACFAHDECYQECDPTKSASRKSDCDKEFGDSLEKACRDGLRGPRNRGRLNWCLIMATVYHTSTVIVGAPAYKASQEGVCECCRSTRVWCKCNQKCYPNGTSCTAECHGTLGCFDNICRPATSAECPP